MKIGPTGESPTIYQINEKGTASMSLTDIAKQLKRQIAAGEPQATITLQRGLKLRLRIVDQQYQLTVWRDHGQPSDMEVSICRKTFDIPAETPGVIYMRWDFNEQPVLFNPATGELRDDEPTKVAA